MPQLDTSGGLDAARTTRAEAARLLEELVRERAAAEARLAAVGREDPIKQVTGRSAFDAAIRQTQDVLARVDAVLYGEVDGQPARPHGRLGGEGAARGVRPAPVLEGR